MKTAAEQLYGGCVGDATDTGAEVRLYVDLDICASGACKQCVVQCSYHYHPNNNGIATIAELATYYLVCRRCEEPHCVNACPRDALEQQPDQDKLLIRHTLRCVTCRSCSHACPYGTIYPEHVPQIVHNCDYCLDRRDRADQPLCVHTCPYGALRLIGRDEPVDARTFPVGPHLMVHSTHWTRDRA